MLFLQDFDLHFIHTPGALKGPTDALSCLPNPNVILDNNDVTFLPDNLFICAIDVALSAKIAPSSSTDPLVLNAMCNIHNNSSLFPCSTLEDWHFASPFQTVFTYHLILTMISSPPSIPLSLLDMQGSSTHTPPCLKTIGGLACLPLSAISLQAVLSVNR